MPRKKRVKVIEPAPLPPSDERSEKYKDKLIATECYTVVRGKTFYKRVFSDGCSELVRRNENGDLVFLCFPPSAPPEQMGLIKEAIKHNFDPGLLAG